MPWNATDHDRDVLHFLEEDVGSGDVTSSSLIAEQTEGRGVLLAKAAGVVCGLDLASRVFLCADARCVLEPLVEEGEAVAGGRTLARVSGPARGLLAAERTALNLLQRMSGIATVTRKFVDRVAGTGARIFATRKTAPGLRAFDKRAVAVGGGSQHRRGLYDQILVKENHLAWMTETETASVRPIEIAVRKSRAAHPDKMVEIEVFDSQEAVRAAHAGAQIVLLDNFTVSEVRDTVRTLSGDPVELEASGGIQLANVREYAETGVRRISIGALTHSVVALDMSLLFDR